MRVWDLRLTCILKPMCAAIAKVKLSELFYCWKWSNCPVVSFCCIDNHPTGSLSAQGAGKLNKVWDADVIVSL